MTILDLFSKRRKRERGEVPDVYVYDDIPQPLQVQIVHIWMETLGNREQYAYSEMVKGCYKSIVDALCKEYGVFVLTGKSRGYDHSYLGELVTFFLEEPNIDRVIDVIEITARLIERHTSDFQYLHKPDAHERAKQAVAELNARFAEHAFGYKYEDGEILRIDSQYVHEESVKPALRLLSQKRYAGAQDEFLSAHEHYRRGNAKEALNDSLKALESTLKVICKRRKWSFPENATSKHLLDIVFKADLVPPFWQSQMSGLRALLEGGVPSGRNRLSGHGQGETPTEVPPHIVAYVLHMTAAAIVFLAHADDAL
jgi:hypothetical protein